MTGPSSSHTAGAVRLGLLARNIYKNEFSKIKFTLYNSFATTGFGHGTDKALLSGVLGYSVEDTVIKNIFALTKNIDYSYEYKQDISKHPNSVDIDFDCGKMIVSGASVGAGQIRITNINGFNVSIDGNYDTLLLMYKDKPGMISTVSNIIQKQKINIASLHCDRSSKGGTASMYLALDTPVGEDTVENVKKIKDVFFVTGIRKLK